MSLQQVATVVTLSILLEDCSNGEAEPLHDWMRPLEHLQACEKLTVATDCNEKGERRIPKNTLQVCRCRERGEAEAVAAKQQEAHL